MAGLDRANRKKVKMSATLGLRKKFDFGDTTLVSVAAMPSAASAFSNRTIQANADGLVHTESSRSLGTVQIATLPTNLDPALVPAGWAGYLIQVTGFTDVVR